MKLNRSSASRILVVDDESLICQLNAKVLKEAGYQVDVAEDGAAAWQAMQHCNYDLLITDNNMPKVTGVDLIRKLKTACRALPVIMATATFPTEEIARCPWLQPDATLLKPYSLAELLRTVKTVLSELANVPVQVAMLPVWERPPVAVGLQLA